MGVVYKASDLGLERTVALKFLPPLTSDEAPRLERFITEARAASALDHPNICTIYEIGETEPGETFIAMAYYSGETLKEKIARGPLPVDRAVDYATQIARGLFQAHQANIVHRDVKPANVIVTDDGVAKILDFGLAKVEDQQLTRTGELFGTLDYMSPEQIQGEKVGTATDVWSTGALLFEMLSGERPFSGANQAAILYSVTHAETPSLAAARPESPPAVVRIVERCLEKDPAQRFTDAGELLEALEGVREGKGATAPRSAEAGLATAVPAPSAAASRPAPSRPAGDVERRRPGWAVGGGLGLAALVAALVVIPGTRGAITGIFAPERALASTYVAVIPSGGGSEEDRILAEGLTHALTGELARLGRAGESLVVLPAAEILNLDVRTAQQVHRQYGVDRIVMVAINRVGEPRVTVTLVDPARQLAEINRVDLPIPDDASFQESVPAALARLMGLRAGPMQRSAATATTDASAFAYYVQGRGYLARWDDPENLDYAVGLFEQALALDPEFAAAHAGLCETRFEQFRRSNDAGYADAARASCAEAERLGRDQVEVLVAVASVYVRTGRADEAERTLGEALARDSLDADAHRWLAWVWEERGDETRAIEEYETAIRLNPRAWVYHSDLAGWLTFNGRYEEAIPHYREIRRLVPDNYIGDLGLSGVYMLLGQLGEAERILQPFIADPPHPRIVSNLGYVFLQVGRFDEAVEVLEPGLDRYPNDMWIRRWLAHAHHFGGDRRAAVETWREIAAIGATLIEVNPANDDVRSAMAEAFVQLGDERRAREHLAVLSADPALWNYNLFHLGRTLEMLGDRDEALRWIGQAVRRGWPIVNVETDPWLTDLRADPGYQEVRERAAAASTRSTPSSSL